MTTLTSMEYEQLCFPLKLSDGGMRKKPVLNIGCSLVLLLIIFIFSI